MTQKSQERRFWLGNLVLLIITFVASLLLFYWQASPLWWILVAALFGLGEYLLYPKGRADSSSTFIIGNLKNSKLSQIDANSETFIDGNVDASELSDIKFNSKGNGEG